MQPIKETASVIYTTEQTRVAMEQHTMQIENPTVTISIHKWQTRFHQKYNTNDHNNKMTNTLLN
jgi:hypothetical protein